MVIDVLWTRSHTFEPLIVDYYHLAQASWTESDYNWIIFGERIE